MKSCAACGHAPAKRWSTRSRAWLCSTCARIAAAHRWTFARFETSTGGQVFATRPGFEVIDDAIAEMARIGAAA